MLNLLALFLSKMAFLVNSYFGKFEGAEALLCLLLYDFLEIGSSRYIVEPENY